MKNYYKIRYDGTDVHALYKHLENLDYSAFFSVKKKYLCSFDKRKNCLYVKENNCRNSLSPQIILYCVNDTTEIICKYTLKAHLFFFFYFFSFFFIIFIGLINGIEYTFKVMLFLIIFFLILFIFYAIIHKIFFVNVFLEFKKDFEKCSNLKVKEFDSSWKFFNPLN
jgi:hypothetical protein